MGCYVQFVGIASSWHLVRVVSWWQRCQVVLVKEVFHCLVFVGVLAHRNINTVLPEIC